MTRTSRIQGLRDMSVEARREIVAKSAEIDGQHLAAFDPEQGIGIELADHMIENVIGIIGIPLGIATNFIVNGREVLVPMASEEASVVAAASNSAKLARIGGGFFTSSTQPIMQAQVQIIGVRDPEAGRVRLLEYLDRAFDWAETHQIKILIDLHTVPDSQNGFDNGGMCGVCKWHKNPAHVDFALTVLEQLTSRYRARLALWGIEVLNEPISEQLWNAIDLPHRYPPRDPEYARGSEPVPTGFLKDFYTTAYRRIRAQSDDVTIVFHDGFRIREWDGFFTRPDFERIVLDTHLYLMEYTFRTGDESPDGYLGHIRNEFGPTVQEMSRQLPLIVGEWCLDPMSSAAAALTGKERLRFYRSLADAQLAAWEGAAGWFFWNYKLLVEGSDRDGWDLRKSIELGYLPENPGRLRLIPPRFVVRQAFPRG